MPWHKFEDKYAEQFSENNGNPAIPFRMAMGALIIKKIAGHLDDDALLDITENPYMQYPIGLREYVEEAPFSQSSISDFRKCISAEMMKEINDTIFGSKNTKDSDDEPPDGGGGGTESAETSEELDKNKGIVLLDATCAPASIAYPTDANLLNGAREKLEGMIDALHPQGCNGLKPRAYRQKARKDYLNFAKQRKPRKKAVRKAAGQQLRYARRNIGHVDRMIKKFGTRNLSRKQREWLLTIRTLCQQQKQMRDTKTHSAENRIASIGQPHVRPIVRGKAKPAAEFGAKVSAHMIEGYAFIDKIGRDPATKKHC